MKLKNKPKIEELLENGDLEKVIEDLKKQVKPNKGLYSSALGLSAQLKKFKSDKIERLMSYEQENLLLNNLRRSILDFIVEIEHTDTTITDDPGPGPLGPQPSPKTGNAWWWLLVPVAGAVAWFMFFNEPTNLPIQVCTLDTMANSGHCCNEDLPRISLRESHGVFYATTFIPEDPTIQAALFLENGSLYPTLPINFRYDMTQGDVCYSAMIALSPGETWYTGRYTLKLLLNGEVAGEKTFEVIQ